MSKNIVFAHFRHNFGKNKGHRELKNSLLNKLMLSSYFMQNFRDTCCIKTQKWQKLLFLLILSMFYRPFRIFGNKRIVPYNFSHDPLTSHKKSEKSYDTITSYARKCCFLLILGLFLPDFGPARFFFKNPAVSLFYNYCFATSYQKSKKSYEPILRYERHGRTHGRTDARTHGQGHFHRSLR